LAFSRLTLRAEDEQILLLMRPHIPHSAFTFLSRQAREQSTPLAARSRPLYWLGVCLSQFYMLVLPEHSSNQTSHTPTPDPLRGMIIPYCMAAQQPGPHPRRLASFLGCRTVEKASLNGRRLLRWTESPVPLPRDCPRENS
jgi:hypothetical protein